MRSPFAIPEMETKAVLDRLGHDLLSRRQIYSLIRSLTLNQHGQITEQVVPGADARASEEYLLYVHLSVW